MSLAEIHFRSTRALEKNTTFTVILPDEQAGPFPVLYLLNGRSDDHSSWYRFTSIERYVSGLPLIVVMPNGERGFYTDWAGVPAHGYESYIVDELIPYVDTVFQTRAERGGRALAGLSMGGYGAFKLALKYPDRFCAAHSMSGPLMIPRGATADSAEHAEFMAIYGPDALGSDNDLPALLSRSDPATRPALRFDCGTDDFLLDHNRGFAAYVEEHHIPHTYVEGAGNHNWKYWDRKVADGLPFVLQHLGIDSPFVPDEQWLNI